MPRVTGNTDANAEVDVTLKEGANAVSGTVKDRDYTVQTDANGDWDITLPPNPSVGAGSVYEFTEAPNGSNTVTTARVPDVVGSVALTDISVTAADGSTVDNTYGQEENDVVSNNVTRIAELEKSL